MTCWRTAGARAAVGKFTQPVWVRGSGYGCGGGGSASAAAGGPEAARELLGVRARGFTLVEVLTVFAIIAVLATLLLTALSSAKKKANQARCTSNLHQISLALNMYLDDHTRRPPTLGHLVLTRDLPHRGVLICPEDRTLAGTWPSALAVSGAADAGALANGTESLPTSYVTPLGWEDQAWNQLMRAGSLAGVAACQHHGLPLAGSDSRWVHDFEGLVLRAQRDGAVVRRQVFWPDWSAVRAPPGAGVEAAAPGNVTFLGPESTETDESAWPLFTDEPAP